MSSTFSDTKHLTITELQKRKINAKYVNKKLMVSLLDSLYNLKNFKSRHNCIIIGVSSVNNY